MSSMAGRHFTTFHGRSGGEATVNVVHVLGEQPTQANTRDRGGHRREAGSTNEVDTHRGSVSTSGDQRGNAAQRGI